MAVKVQYLVTLDLPRGLTRTDLNGMVKDVLRQWCGGAPVPPGGPRPHPDGVTVQTVIPEYKNERA